MKISPFTKSSFKGGFLLIFCIWLQTLLVNSAQITEYNYTFDVPITKLNTLYLSKTEQLKVFQGELLKQFLIKEPKEIGDVYQVQIFPKNQSTNGSELNDNVIEEINDTSLKGVWFESFLWPIKQKSYLYTLQREKSNTTKIRQQIVSVAHNSPKENNTNFNESNIFPLYVLLSSGKIQIVQNDFQMLKSKKQFSFAQIKQSNLTEDLIDWNEAYLYHKRGRLYVYVEEQLFIVSSTKTDEGGDIKRFFTLQNVGLQNVRQIVEDLDDLFALTEEALFKITDKSFQLSVKYSDIFAAFNITDGNLIDVDINNNNFYFLQHPLGIIKYSQDKEFSLLRIQHPQLAKKLNVFQRTILVTYQVGVDNYIQEYQFFPEGDKMFANRIFDYHSDEEVKDVLLYNKYMIINRGPELILGVHSLNRRLPEKFHSKSEILVQNFFLDEIYELRMVRFSFLDPPSYLVVGPRYFQLIRFEPSPEHEIQQKWIKVGSQKTGTCKLSHFYPSEYCSIKNSIQLVVSDAIGQEIHTWWIWLCVAIAGVILSVAAWIFAWKYFSKKQNQFQVLLSSRQTKRNASITMGDKEIDEKTEAN